MMELKMLENKAMSYDDILKMTGPKWIHLAIFFQMGLAGLVDGA